ncbi:MAG: hypothetical protein AB7F31_00340 [Parachlamydiales bacterium]
MDILAGAAQLGAVALHYPLRSSQVIVSALPWVHLAYYKLAPRSHRSERLMHASWIASGLFGLATTTGLARLASATSAAMGGLSLFLYLRAPKLTFAHREEGGGIPLYCRDVDFEQNFVTRLNKAEFTHFPWSHVFIDNFNGHRSPNAFEMQDGCFKDYWETVEQAKGGSVLLITTMEPSGRSMIEAQSRMKAFIERGHRFEMIKDPSFEDLIALLEKLGAA